MACECGLEGPTKTCCLPIIKGEKTATTAEALMRARYTAYVEQGLHFATTRVEVDYQVAVRFDDQIEITAWLAWVRHASLCIRYTIQRGEALVARGATEHAAVSVETGRARRVPRERRDSLRRLAVETAP